MRLGNSRLGETRLGASGVSARGAAASVTVGSRGTVTALNASGSNNQTLSIASDGAAVALDVTPVVPSVTMTMASTAETVALSTGTAPVEYHLTAEGNGQLGDASLTIEAAYPDLIASASPLRDIPERQRIEGYLKRPFETDYPGSQSGGVHGPGEFSKLLDIYGEVAAEINGVKNDTLGSRMVDLAYGQSLDNIGALLLLPRRTGEGDPHYRVRLKAHAQALTGEATVDQIRETLSVLLSCDVSDIELAEPDVPAQFDLTVDETIVNEAEVSVDDVVDLVQRFRAGGVKVTMTVTGSFTYRSLDDYQSGTDLGEKGYGEAGYSGRIL